jgi:enoyl-CoA hydratase
VSDILFERRGVAGVVTLNRPGALNAISHAMLHAFTGQLVAWESDPAVTRVVVTAAGGRAFCAGGDLRALYDLGRAGRYDEALQYWRDEYRLNAVIKRYRKPYIAIVDGIAFGGGVGLAVHGSHRVAGDGARFAMPEVGIGFFPDVGATWFLPRLAGEAGTWCALTGERIDAADATALDLATHRVASSRLPDLLDGLCGAVPVDALLAAFAEPAGIGPIQVHRDAMGRLFGAARVEDILSALDAASLATGADTDFAHRAAATIRTKSPTSLKVALAQLRRGKNLDFEACLRSEFRIVSRVATGHDFYEGIRAVIVDKDHNPAWRPSTLAAVSDADVARYFAPVSVELDLS